MQKIKSSHLSEGQILLVQLNDGKGNVLDAIMMNELQQVLNEVRNEKNIKLILFEGEGKNFSFGASVEEHKKENAAAMLSHFHQLFFTLRDLSIPTVAKVSGQCLGGGMELALMCNFIFSDATAKFGQPEIILGVFPPPASILLSLKVGDAKAEELLITGKTIDATEAKSIGLVNELFNSKAELDAGIFLFAEKHILPKSASSLRFAVRAARMKLNTLLSNYLPELEEMYVKQLMETRDANEGIHSFLEKRKPVWNNN